MFLIAAFVNGYYCILDEKPPIEISLPVFAYYDLPLRSLTHLSTVDPATVKSYLFLFPN